MSSKVSSSPPKASYLDLACGPLESNLWASIPMEAQARLVPPKMSTKQGPTKQMGTPSKDIKSKCHGKLKPHIINKAPKHVHQNYLIKLNMCSKALYNQPSLGMGGVSLKVLLGRPKPSSGG
jgi:hypothetical protein